MTRKIDSAPVTSFRRNWGIWKLVTRDTEKCPLSVLTGVRIERVNFKENIWAFRWEKRHYPLSTGVRRAGFHCIVNVPGPNIVRKADREKLHENRVGVGGGGLGVGAWNNSSFQSITESFIYKYMKLAIVYLKDCILSDSSERSKMSWREEDDRMFFFVGFTRYDSYQTISTPYFSWLRPDLQ